MHEIITLVETAIGRVMLEKMRKEIAETPKTVDLTEPIETIWGPIK